ncbi:MAG: SAM-dependent methyltransferase [Bacteroidetes bacterium]|nr:MAG: SAM-dependent methyltransferase [Bacteroidota bacterium]
MAKLYLIPTPLALEAERHVLSPEIAEVIAQTSYFLVENVRTARRFISSLQLGLNIQELQFETLDKDTDLPTVRALLQPILAGKQAGILSEAGCPAIADPGALAVGEAHKLGIEVVPLVGPSSLLLALMGSGFSGQSFAFNGYLPIAEKEREQAIREAEKTAGKRKQTQIWIETPYRNKALVEALLKTCHPDTFLCIATQLTAPDEWICTKRVRDWRNTTLPELHKKPTVFLLHTP